jgi:methionyl-tRNA synthetase
MSHRTSPARAVNRAAMIAPLLFCFLFATQASTQLQTVPPGQTRPSQAEAEMEEQQKHAAEKALNAKRQQDIKKDTDKLLELATELKEYVDKSNENTLSVDVIKKAEAIEKLAHTVKDKMKGP